MLRPADDLVLQVGRAIQEIIAVSGHAHDQVAVFLRVDLGFAKGVGRDDVELDVVGVHLEIGPDEMAEVAEALLVGQQLRREFLVEERSPGPDVVNLGRRFQDRRRRFLN